MCRKTRVEECPCITPQQIPARMKSFCANGQRICMTTVSVGYGERRYFLCPLCGNRKQKLFRKDGFFACLSCHDLQYTSAQVQGNRYSEILVRANRIGRRLHFSPQPLCFHHGANKPKRMRATTYWPLYMALVKCSEDWDRVWLDDVKKAGFSLNI